MSDKDILRAAFNQYRTCVIIPTYNNDITLPAVIADVAEYTHNIIVVNDGSTDDTALILASLPHIDIVSYPKNKGKGWALRKGFEKAVESGYAHAITIDSDGQHFAKDLPVFMDKLELTKDAIIIGARNMDQSSVPGKSSFGYKFSNFWFKIETGINTPDTQSGYRLYPVALMKDIIFFTRKYEFEIEVLVRAAWKGIKIESVPVSVYYAPKEKRISHFRPFKDFFRISLLNTLLVLIAFLYIKPRNFFLSLFQKRNWGAFFREQVFNVNEPHHIKAFSVALGICMGIMPVWGFQLVTAIFLSIVLKLNKALVIIAANISIPPLIPLIIFFSYKTGAVWMKNGGGSLTLTSDLTFDSVKNNFQQYLYGSITLAIVLGILCGLLTWALLAFFRKKTSTAV
jgi:glycosyltransferase involved in cell wall biosynthesis